MRRNTVLLFLFAIAACQSQPAKPKQADITVVKVIPKKAEGYVLVLQDVPLFAKPLATEVLATCKKDTIFAATKEQAVVYRQAGKRKVSHWNASTCAGKTGWLRFSQDTTSYGSKSYLQKNRKLIQSCYQFNAEFFQDTTAAAYGRAFSFSCEEYREKVFVTVSSEEYRELAETFYSFQKLAFRKWQLKNANVTWILQRTAQGLLVRVVDDKKKKYQHRKLDGKLFAYQ
ncbi:MAG: hypothetical protein AAF518_11895 [Spirochaetota bacterium]